MVFMELKLKAGMSKYLHPLHTLLSCTDSQKVPNVPIILKRILQMFLEYLVIHTHQMVIFHIK